jgi:hypothetical protein
MLCMQERSQFWMKSNIAGSERGTLEAAVSILFQAYQTTITNRHVQ